MFCSGTVGRPRVCRCAGRYCERKSVGALHRHLERMLSRTAIVAFSRPYPHRYPEKFVTLRKARGHLLSAHFSIPPQATSVHAPQRPKGFWGVFASKSKGCWNAWAAAPLGAQERYQGWPGMPVHSSLRSGKRHFSGSSRATIFSVHWVAERSTISGGMRRSDFVE